MNEVPETLDFNTIYHGMMGRDFIVAFNENFNLADEKLIYLLGQMLYCIKSSDIKGFRVSNGVVQYTTDNETWSSVDITEWGNITGSLANQTDLKEVLDSKAAASALTDLSSLVNAINRNLNTLQGVVDVANQNITANANDIDGILTTLQTKVNSTNINAIRLNEDVFQWSPDGEHWYQQEIVRSIPWGNLTGNWEDQSDIYQVITTLQRSLSDLSSTATSLNSRLTTTTNNLNTAIGRISANETNISTLQGKVATLETTAVTLVRDSATKAELLEHTQDTNNPHEVTAAQIGLGNVDNTSDINKPISNAQQSYVQSYVANILSSMSLDKVILNAKNVEAMAITTENDYYNKIDTDYMNALVLVNNSIDDSYSVETGIIEGIDNNWTTFTEFAGFNQIQSSKLKYTIKNNYTDQETQVSLYKINLRIVKNNGSSHYDVFEVSDVLDYGDTKTIESSLPVADANNIQRTYMTITYIPITQTVEEGGNE